MSEGGGTTITVRINAGAHERFAPDAFEAQIGKHIPFNVDDREHGLTLGPPALTTCQVMAAKVSADGTYVDLTIEPIE